MPVSTQGTQHAYNYIAVLLAGGVAAHAQTTTTPGGTGNATGNSLANQCWDVSTNSVKQQAPGSASGSASSSNTVGSTTTRAAPAGSATSGGAATTATTRTSGMRDC